MAFRSWSIKLAPPYADGLPREEYTGDMAIVQTNPAQADAPISLKEEDAARDFRGATWVAFAVEKCVGHGYACVLRWKHAEPGSRECTLTVGAWTTKPGPEAVRMAIAIFLRAVGDAASPDPLNSGGSW